MPPTGRFSEKKGAGKVAVDGIGTVEPRLERFGVAPFKFIHDPAPDHAFLPKTLPVRSVQRLENFTERNGGAGSDEQPCAVFLL